MRQSGESRGPTGSVDQEYEEEEILGYFEPMKPIGLEGEEIEERNTQMGRWFGAVPPDIEFTGWDVIMFAGKILELTGPPRLMWNPRLGEYSHQELSMRIVE
jgi:hypothetical protein